MKRAVISGASHALRYKDKDSDSNSRNRGHLDFRHLPVNSYGTNRELLQPLLAEHMLLLALVFASQYSQPYQLGFALLRKRIG